MEWLVKLAIGLLKHIGLLAVFVQVVLFAATDLSLETKMMMYQSVILGVLLYGVETWAPTQQLVGKLDRLHQHSVCCILGISRTIQWKEHLTTAKLSGCFAMAESIDGLLTECHLRWLGHVAQMPNTRHPKQLLFGWLPQKCLVHGSSFVGKIRSVRI